MRKLLLAMVAVSGLFAGYAHAQNEVQAPLWQCALTFNAHGGGAQLIVGTFKMKGNGNIRCLDIAGNTEVIPVRVTLATRPIALNAALGAFTFAGVSSGVGVASGPEALLGTYYTYSTNGAFLVGYGTNISIHGGAEAVNLNLGLNAIGGIGAQYGITKVTIEALK